MRFKLALFALAILGGTNLMAQTYYVGTCKSGSYSTIQAAVSGVPSGSTINICPGTYAEQVTISQPLTLQGITANNSSLILITMPSGALATTSSILFGTVAAQVEVIAGPVNVTNVTVDGTAGNTNCPSVPYIGIFYSSGSSGTANEVETRNQNCGDGIGIMAENGSGGVETVTVENSNVNNSNNAGIIVCSNEVPTTLSAVIKGNYVQAAQSGIDTECNVGGGVTNNFITSGGMGMFAESTSSSPISGNTVTGGNIGIYIAGSESVTSNHISNCAQDCIYLAVGNVNVKSNTIDQANIGIEFNCNTGTVADNTINGTTIGFDMVPAGFTGVNHFYNVTTDKTTCPAQ
jgi:parallel beta-helix repeat protein